MDQKIRYLKDLTGLNKSNLVRNEKHRLNRQVKNRIAVPREGSFFSKSVTVRDRFKNRNLIKGIDFVCAGLRVELTKETGEEISSFIIVTNEDVSNSIYVTYQTVGYEAQSFAEPAVALLEKNESLDPTYPFGKILDLPKGFTPTFHYEDLGNIDKFEYIIFSLEKIRHSIIFSNKELYKFLFEFEILLEVFISNNINFFQKELYLQMRSYQDGFKKELFGLGNLKNRPFFTNKEATDIAAQKRQLIKERDEAYLNLRSLSAYSKKLFELFVNVDTTGIGASTAYLVPATVDSFQKLPIGSMFIIPAYDFGKLGSNPTMDLMYPETKEKTTGYTVRKLSAESSVHGSMFLYVSKDNSRTYVMRIVKTEKVFTTVFLKIANLKDSESILGSIETHIKDSKNPHMDDKRDVDLAQVENLPIASMEDMICNMPVRKYITVGRLLSYMKRFKTGKKEISEIYENLPEKTQIKRMQTIFSPCGAWDDNIDENKINMCGTPKVMPAKPVTTTTTSEPVSTTTTLAPEVSNEIGILLNDSEFGDIDFRLGESNVELFVNDDINNKTDAEIWDIVKDNLFYKKT